MSGNDGRQSVMAKYPTLVIAIGTAVFDLLWSLFWYGWKYINDQELPGKPVLSSHLVIFTIVGGVVLFVESYRLLRNAVQASDVRRQKDRRVGALETLESGWIRRVFEASIHGEKPMAVPLRRVGSRVAHPASSGLAREGHLRDQHESDEVSIVEVFENSGHSLIVFGAAGSGKTNLLLQLAKELHEKAASDPHAPLPVVLSLATWNRLAGTINGPRAVERWLVSQLKQRYGIDKDIGRKWLDEGGLILLLDGLDEIDGKKTLRQCHGALCNALRERRLKTVITCRNGKIDDWEKLPLNEAVEAQELGWDKVLEYVGGIGNARRLSLALRTDPDARNVMKTPFTVWLALEAYSGASRLPARGEFRMKRLLSDFVKRRFAEIPREKPWSEEQVRRWLRNLARCSQTGRQTVFSLEGMGRRWFANSWLSWLSWVNVVIGTILVCAAFEFVVWFVWLSFMLDFSWDRFGNLYWHLSHVPSLARLESLRSLSEIRVVASWSIAEATFAGCIVGLPVVLVGGSFALRPMQFYSHERILYRIRQSLRLGLLGGITSAVVVGFVGFACRGLQPVYPKWVSYQSLFSYVVGYTACGVGASLRAQESGILGAFVGLFLAVTQMLTSEAGLLRGAFSRAVRSSFMTSGLLGLVTGVLLSLFPYVKLASMLGKSTDVLDPPDIPMGGALLVMLAAGGLFLIRHYVLRLMMVLTLCGPWRYGRFLEKATEYDFLRVVGGTDHMFPHPLVRDFFADAVPEKMLQAK